MIQSKLEKSNGTQRKKAENKCHTKRWRIWREAECYLKGNQFIRLQSTLNSDFIEQALIAGTSSMKVANAWFAGFRVILRSFKTELSADGFWQATAQEIKDRKQQGRIHILRFSGTCKQQCKRWLWGDRELAICRSRWGTSYLIGNWWSSLKWL